jgi:hypothetical protein
MRTMSPDRRIPVDLTDGDRDHRLLTAQCQAESGHLWKAADKHTNSDSCTHESPDIFGVN